MWSRRKAINCSKTRGQPTDEVFRAQWAVARQDMASKVKDRLLHLVHASSHQGRNITLGRLFCILEAAYFSLGNPAAAHLSGAVGRVP